MSSVAEAKGFLAQMTSDIDSDVMGMLLQVKENLSEKIAQLQEFGQDSSSESLGSAIAFCAQANISVDEILQVLEATKEQLNAYNATL